MHYIFAAKGAKGESIFDPSFPVRDGTFRQYTKSDLFNSYHISYYANGRDAPGREISHLRKNTGFNLVQEVEPGIPIKSKAIHKITLIKEEAHILMFIDGRKIIDWQDDGQKYGPVLRDGKMGFRQMQWTDFQYRNFQVWDIKIKNANKQIEVSVFYSSTTYFSSSTDCYWPGLNI